MTTVTKTVKFDAAHILTNHQGLCKNLHGHTYRVDVSVAQPADDGRAAKFIYRSGRPGGQPPGELISGLPYMIPLITGYWNKSFIGEALGAGLLCRMLSPRTPVPASEIERFNRLIVEVDWTKNIASAVSRKCELFQS